MALVRAAAHPVPPLSSWPALADRGARGRVDQVNWLRTVWEAEDFTEGLRYASPSLAQQVALLLAAEEPAERDVRRAVISVVRYLLRARARATPFGHFSGVAPARIGEAAHARWGTEHHAVVRAGAQWLDDVVLRLEGCPELLARLPVVANNLGFIRGEQLVIPHQPDRRAAGTAGVDACLPYKAPVRAALAAAQAPVVAGNLVAQLCTGFPGAEEGTVVGLVVKLVRHGALLSSLRAPSTQTDALGYLVAELEAVRAEELAPVAGLVRALRRVQADIARCNSTAPRRARAAREAAAVRMTAVTAVRRHPLAVDLRLDASLTLPRAVAVEVERAALALARLSAAPYGTAVWKRYHMAFYERFGLGSMVPVADVVADSGIGYPSPDDERPRLSERDEELLRLAQRAAVEGRGEVVVDDALLDSLDSGPAAPRLPPHLEVGVRIHAVDTNALESGQFQLEVVSVSRGAGVGTGRFLGILDTADAATLTAELADLPTGDRDTIAVQLSYPPLAPENAHLTRTPRVLPTVVSLGEHHRPGDRDLGIGDLAVGCDGTRMFLAAPALGVRVEPVGMHALNLHGHHAPPMARFLSEISRSQYAQVTAFDWGAARTLPFLPRLRYGRTVLSAACWRLESDELPGPTALWAVWDSAFNAWRGRRRLPRNVYLAEGDRRLALDVDVEAHRVLLRLHLDRGRPAVLGEILGGAGWCGGRAHEVVIPLKAAEPVRWPALPSPTAARTVGRGRGQSPAASRVVLASLYGDIRRQDTILARHVPELLDRLGSPRWWFVRFRDPEQHLRLRFALPEPEAFGSVARTVSTWADELNTAGLLREIRYPTSYPETGRWGSQAAWDAAEDVFRADSHALLTQLRQTARPGARALATAHMISIAGAFQGDTVRGMRWLIDHVPAAAPAPIPRHEFNEAVRLADPRPSWGALRSEPGGPAIADAWARRDLALAAYRLHLPGPHTAGIDPDAVLGSLLHCHFVRAVRIDFAEEALCTYLARAAALAWIARTTGSLK
ncbi:lantibiotic dehydratase [Streptomyces subrutilus]|uniref:lantibiotic dehydratase n=1 Tax=Streptomyces subrutilus TaxID=36818 RepID=UPI001E5AA45F|nr:lantibiotic dehydratase [Streptomyces subrutilus]